MSLKVSEVTVCEIVNIDRLDKTIRPCVICYISKGKR